MQKQKILHDKKNKALLAAQKSNYTRKIEKLQGEIAKLGQQYELYKAQANLLLEAEMTAKKQIAMLDVKVKNDKKELATLKGDVPLPSVAPTPATGKTHSTPAPSTINVAPGISLPLGTTATSPSPQKPISTAPETAEQIAARRVAQQKTLEAEQAEKAIVNAVASKQALEEQIELKQKLRTTAEKSLANLTATLAIKQQERRELKKTGVNPVARDQLITQIKNLSREIRSTKNEIKLHSEQIEKLTQSLGRRQQIQEKVVEIAAEKEKQAKEARQKSVWLESPLHPANILRWTVSRGPRVLFVFIGIILLLFISRLSFTRIAMVIHAGVVARKNPGSTGQALCPSASIAWRGSSLFLVAVF